MCARTLKVILPSNHDVEATLTPTSIFESENWNVIWIIRSNIGSMKIINTNWDRLDCIRNSNDSSTKIASESRISFGICLLPERSWFKDQVTFINENTQYWYFDVSIFTETDLTDGISVSLLKFPNSAIYRKDRSLSSLSRTARILIAVKKEWNSKLLPSSPEMEQLFKTRKFPITGFSLQ